MIHKSKCYFCKQMKPDVIWRFATHLGCKDCADEYVRRLMR